LKRLLVSLILALGVHGLILGMDFDWLEKTSTVRAKNSVISMSLIAMHPKPPDPSPVINELPLLETELSKKMPKQPPKAKPRKKQTIPLKKIFKPPVQPEKKDPSKIVAKEPLPSSSEPSAPTIKPDVKETSSSRTPLAHPEVIPEPAMGSVDKNIAVTHPSMVQEAKPLYDKNPPPEYPRIAQKRGYQGTVVLEVLVGRNGSVDDLRIFTSSGHAILDNAAMKSVKEWLFEPGKRGGETMDMWVRIPVRFELK